MIELWQLYDERGEPLVGKGASKDDVFDKGLLHGAAQVWIWRNTAEGKEILLQRRANDKRTWPNLLDISAAGHINLDETPEIAAVRETQEEIGFAVSAALLQQVAKHRFNVTTANGAIENEFRWVYLLEITSEATFKLQESEVASTQWIPLDVFRQSVIPNNGDYVPQGDDYYQLLLSALDAK